MYKMKGDSGGVLEVIFLLLSVCFHSVRVLVSFCISLSKPEHFILHINYLDRTYHFTP